MRLNFQQQRPVQSSFKANTFIPEQEVQGLNQYQLQRQLIDDAIKTVESVGNAAEIIAKANRQAKEAEQQSDIADARLKIGKIKEDIELGVEINQNTTLSYMNRDETQEDTFLNKNKSGYFKYTSMEGHQGRVTEWLKKKVIADYEAEGDEKFARQLEREVEFSMGNAFGNAKKSAVKHTKNALSVSLVKENENFARDLEKLDDVNQIQELIKKRHAEIPNQLQGTFLPEEIEAKQAKFIENSITQLAFKLSDPDSSKADHALYQNLYKKGMKGEGIFKNSNPLFWMRLHRDAGQRIFNMQKSDELAMAKSAVQYDPEKFFTQVGVKIDYKEINGKIIASYIPKLTPKGEHDPDWGKKFKQLFPKLEDSNLDSLLKTGLKKLQSAANDALKKEQYKGAEKTLFDRKVAEYFGFMETTWVANSEGLRRTTIDPPPPPWNKTTFKGAEWENHKANLIQMEQIYTDADEAYRYSLMPKSSPEKINEKLDDIYDRIQKMPVYSEGLRMQAMAFYQKIQPMFKKEEFKAGNATVTGENNANRRADHEGRSSTDENLIGDGMKDWEQP